TYQAATGVTFTPVSDSAFVTVGSPSGMAVSLSKSVDRASATLGDSITYTLAYQGVGSASATNVVVGDVLPAGAVYVPASIRWNGTLLTDATGDDAGAFDGTARRVTVTIPTVTGTDAGTITFRARLDGTASPADVARVAYVTPLGADSTTSNSVLTTLPLPNISIAKVLEAPVAPAVARIGDEVRYRIRYDNPAGSVVARNVVVTDTLAAGLEYVTAVPAATVSGAVLTWTLGDVAAGTTADISLRTGVAPTLPDSGTVINGAALAAGNGTTAVSAAAAAVLLLPSASGTLVLTHTADVLEVGLGQAVPYTLTLQNRGVTAFTDIRIAAHLSEGGRYPRGSAGGAGSGAAHGRDVTFYVTGPLAPGATARVHYSVGIVSAGSDVIQNTAVATVGGGTAANSAGLAAGVTTAAGATVQSDSATALVRVQRAWPLETRAGSGKIFV